MILSSKTIWSSLLHCLYLPVHSFLTLTFFFFLFFFLFKRYAHDEEAAEDQEETGWKYIHGDVFRFPKYKSLFAAALGSGTQLFTLWVLIHPAIISSPVLSFRSFSSFFFSFFLFNLLICTLCSTIFIFILALVGVFYPYNRGALFTALVVIYALTSGIAGYTATSFYCQLEGTNWVCADEFCVWWTTIVAFIHPKFY